MRRILCLHGHLGSQFGETHEYDADSMRDLLGLFILGHSDIKNVFSEGRYRVYLGDEPNWVELNEQTLNVTLGKQNVHIFPVIEGEGGDSKGILVGVLGIALLATGIGLAISAGSIAAGGISFGALGTLSAKTLIAVGGMLALSGISSMLTPTPEVQKYEEREAPDERASFLFDGPRNRSEQGSCVPVVYGTMRIGGTVVSAGYSVEEIGSSTGEGGSGATGTTSFVRKGMGSDSLDPTYGGEYEANDDEYSYYEEPE